MADRDSSFANAYESTLSAQMGSTDTTATVATTTGGPTSPCYLAIEPDDDAQREYIYFDGTFTGTTFVTSTTDNRYLTGSAAGSGLTHPSGSVIRSVPAAQMFEDLHDRIDVLRDLPDAKGDLFTATAADTAARLAVGSDDTVLIAASGQATGLTWGNVNTAQLAADAVDGTKIADDAVDSEHIAAGAVDNEHLAADIITGDEIADDSIDSEHYVAGSIDNEHLAANSVDSDQYVDGSIDLVHMSANSVDSDQYVDGSIDNVHIANNTITEAKMALALLDLIGRAGSEAGGSPPSVATGGFQIQVAKDSVTTNSSTPPTVTFPAAFSNGVVAVLTTSEIASSKFYVQTVGTTTTSGFTIRAYNVTDGVESTGEALDVRYVAIGW